MPNVLVTILRYFGSSRRKREWTIRAALSLICLLVFYFLFYSVMLKKLEKVAETTTVAPITNAATNGPLTNPPQINDVQVPVQVFPSKRPEFYFFNITEVYLLPWEQKNYHQIPDFSNPQLFTGPGEMGRPVVLTADEQKRADEEMKKWFMNVVASDKVSLDRSLTDRRAIECQALKYDPVLPTTSVVIIFTDEAFSPLLRTVHSVVNRTPKHLLKEVILVDDFSQNGGAFGFH